MAVSIWTSLVPEVLKAIGENAQSAGAEATPPQIQFVTLEGAGDSFKRGNNSPDAALRAIEQGNSNRKPKA